AGSGQARHHAGSCLKGLDIPVAGAGSSPIIAGMKLVSSVIVPALLLFPLALSAQQAGAPAQRVANPAATPAPAANAPRSAGAPPRPPAPPAAHPPATAAQRTPPPPATTPQIFAPGTNSKVPETITPTWETRTDYRTYYFEIPAPRGLITDRNGEPLAQSRLA